MAVEKTHIAVAQLLAVHLLQSVGEQPAVQADETLLWKFANQSGDVFLLHIGVGVVFAAGGGIFGFAVVDEEIEAVASLAVLGVALAIEHVAFSHGKVSLSHERYLHLVLNFLHCHSVADAHTGKDNRQVIFCRKPANREKSLADGIFNLFYRERFTFTIAFHDNDFRTAHFCVTFWLITYIKWFSDFQRFKHFKKVAFLRI
jgi:hypothetical protein